MSALSLHESPSPSPSPTTSDSLPLPTHSLSPSPAPPSLPRPRKRRPGLSKRAASEFSAYRTSIAATVPALLDTQLPLLILQLHHLVLAFPDWPTTSPPSPCPALPPYQPAVFSPATKLDPASYLWRPHPRPAPHLSHHPKNAALQSIYGQFRPLLVELSALLQHLSHFLHLSLPAFDETSNAALNTPQAALSAVRRQQRYVRGWLGCRVQYLAARGAMLEKCVDKGWEWNHVAALAEWDEREWMRWRNGMRELRGRMVGLWCLLDNNSQRLLQHSSFQTMTT